MNFFSNILLAVFNFFFGCSHNDVSRPFTLGDRTYKVCVTCGKEFPYSLQTMSYARRGSRTVAPARAATILAFDASLSSREAALREKAAA